jgi:hypothetical protein
MTSNVILFNSTSKVIGVLPSAIDLSLAKNISDFELNSFNESKSTLKNLLFTNLLIQ